MGSLISSVYLQIVETALRTWTSCQVGRGSRGMSSMIIDIITTIYVNVLTCFDCIDTLCRLTKWFPFEIASHLICLYDLFSKFTETFLKNLERFWSHGGVFF